MGVGEGQWAKQDGVDDAENDDVCADAQGKNEHGDDGEAAVAAQAAKSVAEVLKQNVEPGQAARLAVVFASLLDAAEADEGLAAGFFGRHAALDVFFDGEFEMRGHLGVELTVERLLMKEGADAVESLMERKAHRLPLSSCMESTRPITLERRCQ